MAMLGSDPASQSQSRDGSGSMMTPRPDVTVFGSQATRTKRDGVAATAPRQRTIARPVEAQGKGLHTGIETRVRLKPAEPGAGVVFVRTDVAGFARIPAVAKNRVIHPRRTAIKKGDAEVHTVEHLLSAARGLGIDNLEVELDGAEAPGLDGSAKKYVEMLRDAGVIEQDAARPEIVVNEPIGVSNAGASLVALPNERGLRISYTLDYSSVKTLKSQHLSLEVDEARYVEEIAPARTFCTKQEADALLAAGLGKGANTENTVVYGDEGVIDTQLRFQDEAVRHKILDLIGDLALLGAPLRAHVIAVKSGHDLNIELVRKLLERHEEAEEVRAKAALGQELDVTEIMRVLPHRYPFLLVDKIVEIEGAQRAVGIKNVTFNEPFFAGHFPGQPVMPGVLLIEAMAQVTGAMILRSREYAGKLAYLLGLDEVKFRKTVVPGDQVVIESEALRVKERTGQARCKASVDGKVVCEALIKFMLVDAQQ